MVRARGFLKQTPDTTLTDPLILGFLARRRWTRDTTPATEAIQKVHLACIVIDAHPWMTLKGILK